MANGVDTTAIRNRLMAARGNNSNAGTTERPKTQVWINVGFPFTEADGTVKLISLPLGIPVDDLKEVDTNSKNEDFRAFQIARNDLLDQVKALANKLAPGEEADLPFTVTMRRIEDHSQKPVAENRYAAAVKLNIE